MKRDRQDPFDLALGRFFRHLNEEESLFRLHVLHFLHGHVLGGNPDLRPLVLLIGGHSFSELRKTLTMMLKLRPIPTPNMALYSFGDAQIDLIFQLRNKLAHLPTFSSIDADHLHTLSAQLTSKDPTKDIYWDVDATLIDAARTDCHFAFLFMRQALDAAPVTTVRSRRSWLYKPAALNARKALRADDPAP